MSIHCYMTGDFLPMELSAHIFSYLQKKDLLMSASVCQDWHRRTSLNEIWIKFFPRLSFIPNRSPTRQK